MSLFWGPDEFCRDALPSKCQSCLLKEIIADLPGTQKNVRFSIFPYNSYIILFTTYLWTLFPLMRTLPSSILTVLSILIWAMSRKTGLCSQVPRPSKPPIRAYRHAPPQEGHCGTYKPIATSLVFNIITQRNWKLCIREKCSLLTGWSVVLSSHLFFHHFNYHLDFYKSLLIS